MTEREEIAAWINSDRDYDKGLILVIAYHQERRNEFEKLRSAARLFNFLRDRYYELREQEPAAAGEEKKAVPAEPTTEHVVPKELLTEWGIIKTEQERLHAEMCIIGTGRLDLTDAEKKQRSELARMIIERERNIEALASAINYYKLNGKLPEGYTVVEKRKKAVNKYKSLSDSDKILKLKNSILPGISKLKRKIEDTKPLIATATGKELDKLNGKLNKWESQLKELDDERKRITTENK